MGEALVAWTAITGNRTELDGVAVEGGPQTSGSEDFRYWRCGLADGSRIAMRFHAKDGDRAAIGLGHERLGSAHEAERWRAFWKGLLKQL
jgi:hypothetical protein